MKVDYLVIGGGIAGVTCVETLLHLDEDATACLLAAKPLVKTVSNIRRITKLIEDFEVTQMPLQEFGNAYAGKLLVIQDVCAALNADERFVTAGTQETIHYEKLCICSGGSPKVVSDNPHVLGIRDMESVQEFQKKLAGAKRIIVVGNGGIATELVYELENVAVIWSVRHESISATFFDSGAARFLLPRLMSSKASKPSIKKQWKYTVCTHDDQESSQASDHRHTACGKIPGSALGPDWSCDLPLSGGCQDEKRNVSIVYNSEVSRILSFSELSEDDKSKIKLDDEDASCWPVYVELTNGDIYGCDFMVSATGVDPCSEVFTKDSRLKVTDDGGILIDESMLTSLPNVYAAGDVCSVGWTTSPHWFQMRLWSQARQMGFFAARCMHQALRYPLEPPLPLDFSFELFTHVTRFFNYKIILLGLYNAQGLSPDDYHLLLRVTVDTEFIKCVMNQEGRMQGCILIGETDLEETFENLILNQLDLSQFQEHLLDPNIDIDDYFD